MAVTYNYGAAPTYVKIASYTTTGATSSYTFTNIPQGYTDLVLVTAGVGSGTENLECYINGDTGNNYSFTYLYGDGTTAGSSRNANTNRVVVGRLGTTTSHGIAHFQNYSSAQMNKSVLTKKGKGNEIVMFFSNIWLNTSPITSLQIFGAGSPAKTMSAGYTISLYGIKAALVPKASGGDIIVQDGTYWYHAFRTTGKFVPKQSLTCDYLVVAGGGGGSYNLSSGAGAGGYRSATSQSFSSETIYTMTIGAGGTAGAGNGTNGSASSISGSGFTTFSASGGGRGSAGGENGISGGSGGGAPTGAIYTGGAGNAGGYTPVEGYAGGATTSYSGVPRATAGGGGAGAVGQNSAAGGAGIGGIGGAGSNAHASWLSAVRLGVSGYLAGGGGGTGESASSAGGAGGGGASGAASGTGVAGGVNTGGGGGGGGNGNGIGGAGGSGLVIVRYSI